MKGWTGWGLGRFGGMWWKLSEFGNDAVYYWYVELTGVSRCRNARLWRKD